VSEIWPTVCGTGHRQMTQADARWLHDEILRVLAKLEGDHGMTEVVSGMALGFDQQLAEMALVCNLRLHAVPPFPSQFVAWPEAQQNHWHELIMMAAEITPASPRDPDFANPRQVAAMLHGRNDTMLKMSQAVIAAADLTKLKWKGDRVVGGTWSCVEKAKNKGMPIIWMDPRARTVKIPTQSGWERIFREQKERFLAS
jgi:uncharacterized phage-like protein YoqJ